MPYFPPCLFIGNYNNLPQRHGDTEENNKEKWGNLRKREWDEYFILSFLHLSTFSLSP